MKENSRVFLLAVCCAIFAASGLCAATAKITLRVVDEVGRPMGAFPVNAGFYAGDAFKGKTDTNGLFVMEGKTIHWEVNWMLKDVGYYRSYGKYEFKHGGKKDKWEPWDPVVTTVVRRIENPVPMYAKRVETVLTATNRWHGFDLEVGELTRPDGNGTVTDLLFRVDGAWKNYRENSSMLRLSFCCPLDGAVPESSGTSECEFKMSREAPKEGYERALEWRKMRTAMEGRGNDVYLNDLDNFNGSYFRTRTETNETGAIIHARYGKIRSGMAFGGAGTDGCYLRFTYYLNPSSNDRNMEFDPKRNLLKNLKSTEEVRAP